MNFVALRMLTGDHAKYVGLVFAIAFSTFLLENQGSIFAGIMKRTTSQILDVTDADIWVMDKKTQYIDEVKALTDNDLYRVRGEPGVLWAVRFFKGQPRAKALDGTFRVVIMRGLDDVSLVGAPSRANEAARFGRRPTAARCRHYRSRWLPFPLPWAAAGPWPNPGAQRSSRPHRRCRGSFRTVCNISCHVCAVQPGDQVRRP
jgi:hypothetical protein